MPDPFDPIKALGKIPASHTARLRFYANADRHIINTIQLGVIFVMAWWSGPSRQAFAKLKQVLEKIDPNGKLEIVVVDTDGCPDLYVCPEFLDQLYGYGEIGWIRDGQVIRTSGRGFNPECFEPYTRQILEMSDIN